MFFFSIIAATALGIAKPGDTAGVLVKATTGQNFTVVVDGEPHALVGGETDLVLSEMSAGVHSVEIRSADRLTVWGHGALHLIDGETVVLTLEEGRSVQVRGREGVWRHTTDARPEPRKQPGTTEK
jgi:hypothetical protein